ncbi:MAG TPA: hypothetical protein VFA36_06035, partial [Burkholderiales bacterium]|nr:hypothetical protein [Burkholderiales bacterium]
MGAQRSAMAHDPDRTVVAGAGFEFSEGYMRWVHVLAGPALFFVSLALPFLGPINARFGFGILFWM